MDPEESPEELKLVQREQSMKYMFELIYKLETSFFLIRLLFFSKNVFKSPPELIVVLNPFKTSANLELGVSRATFFKALIRS